MAARGARAHHQRGGEDAALREDLARSRERVDDGARCESDGHDLVLSELGPNDHVPGWDKLVVYGKHVIWSDREGGAALVPMRRRDDLKLTAACSAAQTWQPRGSGFVYSGCAQAAPPPPSPPSILSLCDVGQVLILAWLTMTRV